MKIAAFAFVACLAAFPVAAQDFDMDAFINPFHPDYEAPGAGGSDNPALDQAMERLDREQWQRTMRALEENAQQEMMRRHGLAACATIWNNPAAAEACRRAQGGW